MHSLKQHAQRGSARPPVSELAFNPVVYGLNMTALAGLALDIDRSDEVFRVTRSAVSSPASLDTARAIALARAGRSEAAEELLRREVLSVCPEHEHGQLVLASLIMVRQGSGWREILERLQVVGEDEEIRRAAIESLEAVDA
jgi:hypothetical protein